MTETKYHSGEGRCDDPLCANDCHRTSAEVIGDSRDRNAVTATTYDIAYVYVGEGDSRMRLQREKWGGHVWGWTATAGWIAGMARGAVFGSWHEMMAYALERQALTPAEYHAAYELLEAK